MRRRNVAPSVEPLEGRAVPSAVGPGPQRIDVEVVEVEHDPPQDLPENVFAVDDADDLVLEGPGPGASAGVGSVLSPNEPVLPGD